VHHLRAWSVIAPLGGGACGPARARAGVLSLSDKAWEEARRRAAVMGPFAATGSVPPRRE